MLIWFGASEVYRRQFAGRAGNAVALTFVATTTWHRRRAVVPRVNFVDKRKLRDIFAYRLTAKTVGAGVAGGEVVPCFPESYLRAAHYPTEPAPQAKWETE